MRAFRFRLETVLKLRRREEDRRLKTLTEQRVKVARARERETELRGDLARAVSSSAPEAGEDLNPGVRAERWAYVQGVADAIEVAVRDRQALEDEAEVMSDRLRMAVRDREIVERLKETRLALFREADRRREQKRMDFVVTILRREASS